MTQFNKKLSKNKLPVTLIFCAIIVVLPVFFYSKHFAGKGIPLSSESSDWGSFGDFVSLFVSLANLVVFIILTYEVVLKNEDLLEREKAFLKIQEKPVISFSYRDDPRSHSVGAWEMQNVGRGPALNLRVGLINSPAKLEFDPNIGNYFSIPAVSEKLDVVRGQMVHLILAVYNDIRNSSYYTICLNNRIYTGKSLEFDGLDWSLVYNMELKTQKLTKEMFRAFLKQIGHELNDS